MNDRSQLNRLICLPFLLLLAGCTCEGAVEIQEGSLPLEPGETLQLAFIFDATQVSGKGDCDGFWYVNDLEGGSDEVGTIDSCGLYTAPQVIPTEPVEIMAASYAVGTCMDCCPYGTLTLELASP